MRKKALQDRKMASVEYVEQASKWAKELTHSEARGPGDMENAWRRLEARYGIPWRTFWALRYRKPRDITVGVFVALQEAREHYRQQQIMRLRHDIETTKKIAGARERAVASAVALVGENESEN